MEQVERTPQHSAWLRVRELEVPSTTNSTAGLKRRTRPLRRGLNRVAYAALTCTILCIILQTANGERQTATVCTLPQISDESIREHLVAQLGSLYASLLGPPLELVLFPLPLAHRRGSNSTL